MDTGTTGGSGRWVEVVVVRGGDSRLAREGRGGVVTVGSRSGAGWTVR